MKKVLILLIFLGLVLWGCVGAKPEQVFTIDDTPSVSGMSPDQWQYPIAAGVWYPGDGELPDHVFTYYRIRCWPGCHDPSTQPRAAHH
jgi:hypothetical protein